MRKKVIKVEKEQKRPLSEIERENYFIKVRKQLINAVIRKQRVVFVDETLFTWRTTPTSAYSRQNTNIMIKEKNLNQ